MKKILLSLFFLLILFTSLFFLNNKYSLFPSKIYNPYEIKLIGVIRDSGLRKEETDLLGIPLLKYQISDLKGNTFYYESGEYDGAYLLDSNVQIAKNIGKCVELDTKIAETDNLADPSYTINGQYTYKRIVVNPIKMKILNRKECSVYTTNDDALANQNDQNKRTLTGKIARFQRPAPDIGYDYQVILKEPITDNNNASGLPQIVNSYLISPVSDEIWELIEQEIEKDSDSTVIEGYDTWGYAESKYIIVTAINL